MQPRLLQLELSHYEQLQPCSTAVGLADTPWLLATATPDTAVMRACSVCE